MRAAFPPRAVVRMVFFPTDVVVPVWKHLYDIISWPDLFSNLRPNRPHDICANSGSLSTGASSDCFPLLFSIVETTTKPTLDSSMPKATRQTSLSFSVSAKIATGVLYTVQARMPRLIQKVGVEGEEGMCKREAKVGGEDTR